MENDFKIKIIILGGGGSKHCKATFIHRQNSIPDIQEYLLFRKYFKYNKGDLCIEATFLEKFCT